MKNNSRRVVVITGASAGVGRAVAREFGKEGACVGLISRDRKALEDTKEEIEDLGGTALVLPCDVSEYVQLERAAESVEREFGPIDVWINNAMVSVFSEVKDMTPEEFRRVTEVTYLGYVWGTKIALKRMLPRNQGRIIQVGSALAYRGIPLQSAYCGAKHAVRGFTDSLRAELIHDKSKVKISMVQLPAVNTPQFSWEESRLPNKSQPVPPIYQPEVPAQAIHWISKHYRRELYVGASTAIVINGNKFFPGIGDRYLALTGFDSQMTKEKKNPDQKSNLWNFVSTPFKAHGSFDERSKSWSLQLFLDENISSLVLLASGIVGARLLLRRNKSRPFGKHLTRRSKHRSLTKNAVAL